MSFQRRLVHIVCSQAACARGPLLTKDVIANAGTLWLLLLLLLLGSALDWHHQSSSSSPVLRNRVAGHRIAVVLGAAEKKTCRNFSETITPCIVSAELIGNISFMSPYRFYEILLTCVEMARTQRKRYDFCKLSGSSA